MKGEEMMSETQTTNCFVNFLKGIAVILLTPIGVVCAIPCMIFYGIATIGEKAFKHD